VGFINLNLYQHPSGVAFDPAKVIRKAEAFFPEAVFEPGDFAAAEVQRAETRLAEELRKDPTGPASKVLASLRRKAQSYGPNYVFRIPLEQGGTVDGLVRSVGVQFLYKEPLPEPVRQRLIAFLRSLGVGRLQASVPDRRQSIVLDDLNGPSDCLRDQPGVPWDPVPDPEPAHSADTP